MVTTEPGAARDLLAEALDGVPDLLWARLELAAWYGDRALYEQAHELLAASGASGPVVQGAMFDLDAALWGPVAVPKMRDLARDHPRCIRVNVGLAEGAMEVRRWDLAAEAATRLTDLTPGAVAVIDLNQRLAEDCGDGEALRELLSQDDGQTIRALMADAIHRALKGDFRYAKEVWDRIDGKVLEQMDFTSGGERIGPDLTGLSAATKAKVLKELGGPEDG